MFATMSYQQSRATLKVTLKLNNHALLKTPEPSRCFLLLALEFFGRCSRPLPPVPVLDARCKPFLGGSDAAIPAAYGL